MPPVPGYIGVTPFRNRNADYQDFLRRLQQTQRAQGKDIWTDFPDYASEYAVDSILSLAKALSNTPPEKRLDGNYVTWQLRKLDFNGITGRVRFTPQGDRYNPRFSIMNLQKQDDNSYEWVIVGSTGPTEGSANFTGNKQPCFAEVGCGKDKIPTDSYPVPKDEDPIRIWLVVVFPVVGVLLPIIGVLLVFYSKARRDKKDLITNIAEMKEKIHRELDDIDNAVEKAKRRRNDLILQRGALQEKPEIPWCDTDKTLVEVQPDNDQYWTVAERLQETMPDAHISKLWRIQNESLWSYYSFHKDRLEMVDIDHNERSVWHGTGSLDPSVIYNDRQDGFTMQFSRDGFLG